MTLILIALLLQDIDTLVKDLMSDDTTVRDTATQALIAQGKEVIPAVRKLARSSDKEVATRAKHILSAIEVNEQAKTSHFPLHQGFHWEYAVTGGPQKKVTLETGGEKKVTVYTMSQKGDTRAGTVVRVLTGFEEDEVYIIALKDGIRIVAKRHIGIAGTPEILPVAEYRWGGKANWSFRSMSGCIAFAVKGNRTKTEKVKVPAGTFECVKISNNTETVWLARGVGIVKRTVTVAKTTVTWELTSSRTQVEK